MAAGQIVSDPAFRRRLRPTAVGNAPAVTATRSGEQHILLAMYVIIRMYACMWELRFIEGPYLMFAAVIGATGAAVLTPYASQSTISNNQQKLIKGLWRCETM